MFNREVVATAGDRRCAPVVGFLASDAARMVAGATCDVIAGDSARNAAWRAVGQPMSADKPGAQMNARTVTPWGGYGGRHPRVDLRSR